MRNFIKVILDRIILWGFLPLEKKFLIIRLAIKKKGAKISDLVDTVLTKFHKLWNEPHVMHWEPGANRQPVILFIF